jgi:hypothetical protein
VYLDTISAYPNPVGGGPFQAHVVTPFDGYQAGATFQTFCIEITEEFYPGSSNVYEVNVSDHAEFGHNGPPNGDPLTSETAWLYSSWRHGALAGVVNNNTAGDLYALQDAIWVTQGWTSPPIPGTTPGATPGLETTLLGLASAHANGSLYDVRVMQMWDVGPANNPDEYVGEAGHAHQDQLILIPAPTTVAGGLLLMGSVGIFRVVRRRECFAACSLI